MKESLLSSRVINKRLNFFYNFASFALRIFIMSVFITTFSLAQVIIEENVEVNPNGNQNIPDTTGKKVLNLSKNVQTNNAQSTFLMPVYGRVKVEITYSEAAGNSRISLEIRQQEYSMLCEYGNNNVGFTWTSDIFDENTPVEFGIDWYWNYWGTIYQGKEAGASVSHPSEYVYTMGFEALGDDWDYNELVIKVTIIPANIVATISPSEIFPGDTATVILKNRLSDGTLVDFPPEQTFEVAKLEGCIFGNILVGSSLSSYFYDVTQPIKFVADTSISVYDTLSADTGKVMLKIGLVDQLNKPKSYNKILQPSEVTDCFIGNFNSASYDDAKVNVVGPELIILEPTATTQDLPITSTPSMPQFIIKAQMKRNDRAEFNFEWKYVLSWTNNNQDPPRQIKKIYEGTEPGLLSGISTWEINWGNDIRGGDVDTLFVTVYDGLRIYKKTVINPYRILGTNPPISNVKANLSLQEQVVVYMESRWRQFGGNGFPLFGPPHGYGLAQLDNPSTSDEEVWNWVANKASCVSRLEEKRQSAITFSSRMRARTLLDPSNENWLPLGYSNVPDFSTDEQIWKETFQRYNGGAYWRWVPNDLNNRNSGGNWIERQNSGYGDNAWTIYTNVNSGNPPNDWN